MIMKIDLLGGNFGHQVCYSKTKKTSLKMTTMKKKRRKKITSIEERLIKA